MKRIALIFLTMNCALLVFIGCSKQNDIISACSLTDIKKEAKDFSYQCSSFEISDKQILLPDNDLVETITFSVDSDQPDEIEQKFIENLKVLMKNDTVDRNLINYYIPNEMDGKYEIVAMDKATDKQRKERNAYLIYFDGRYQEVLYKTSMMCELGDNCIPSKYIEDIDFSSQWTHTGLDLGELVKSFDVTSEDIGDSKYSLINGEYSVREAVEYVEKHIGKDYFFVGSDILEYSVYQVDVRKLKDDIYYYQFKVKAGYKGMSFDKDEASYENQNINAESHIVSMFDKDEIGYIWSCCHSYSEIASQEKVDEMISLQDACKFLEKEITSKRKFDIDSVELLYLTEFVYDKKDTAVEQVKVYPVYHFYVENPRLAGFSTLCFEVNACTGEVVVGK